MRATTSYPGLLFNTRASVASSKQEVVIIVKAKQERFVIGNRSVANLDCFRIFPTRLRESLETVVIKMLSVI